MRTLPDPDITLREATDFIFSSRLARRALSEPSPLNSALLLRDLINEIYKLTISCHLAEFTDHGLSHLCSLVERISEWTTQISATESEYVVSLPSFSSEDANVLLFATLLHDIGMLSQRPEDLPLGNQSSFRRATQDTANWVRETHIPRMENLTRRLFQDSELSSSLNSEMIQRAFNVAKAHGSWPKDWGKFEFSEIDSALAAILAVVDLLDEDSARCDSSTLLRHRFGTALNVAHWIRHGLTANRVRINHGIITVDFERPTNTDCQFAPVFAALRNHYRLSMLYAQYLQPIGINLTSFNFDDEEDIPRVISEKIGNWQLLPEFPNQSALIYNLLESFMPEALLDATRLNQEFIIELTNLGLEQIDLSNFHQIRGGSIPRTIIERVFHSILGR